MTTVNWERESGEKVEEFVASLLLLKHSHGNRITPSKGDRGVDVRVWNPDGHDIYQVKRYSRALTAKQATSVEASWNTFAAQTLPVLRVRSWTLVTPWEPTNERLDWLEQLTAGSGIRTGWMGSITLDGLAADNPALVEYYFGDGGQRLQRLMADALQGGRNVTQGVPAEDLLNAIVARQRSLATALNEVDPFYRYDLQVRTGRVEEQPWNGDLHTASPAAWVHYRQPDEQTYLVMRLLPRCAESLRLRPITGSVQLEVPVGSPEHQAVEDWLRYGAPLHNVPGTVTNVSGPPSLLTSSGPGRFSFMAAEADSDRPDLEIRLLAADDSVTHTLELVEVRVSRGLDGPGAWLSGTDRAGVLEFRFLLGGPDRDQVRMTMTSLIGKTPADVLSAVRLVAGLASGGGLVLAVRGGRPLTPIWHPEESEIRASPFVGMAHWTVTFLEALLAMQAHTYQRVTIPDLEEITPDQIAEIIGLGRLLRGEEIHTTWTQIIMTLGAQGHLPPPDLEFSLMETNQLQVNLGGRQIILDDVQRRVLYHSARPADPHELTSARSGDTIRLVPGSTAKATMAVVPVGGLDG